MNITEFTFRIVLIFLPGLVTFYIVSSLTIHDKESAFELIFKSLLFGFITYLLYYALCAICGWEITFFDLLINSEEKIRPQEILAASGFAIVLGLIISWIINFKLVFRLARFFRVTRKIGEPGIWSHIMDMPDKVCPKWICVADLKNGIYYYGYIQLYSDNKEPEDEIFLRNVTAFEYKDHTIGQKLYESPAVYLNRKRSDLIIEFPQMPHLQLPQPKENAHHKENINDTTP